MNLTQLARKHILYWLCVSAAVAVFLHLAARDIELPGIQYDEVLQAPSAIHFLRNDVLADYNRFGSMPVMGRTIALMNLEYIGALKSYVFALSFAVFGIHVTVLRLTNLFIAAIGLLYTGRFAKETIGRRAALCGVWLVATDPSFILCSRTDWGPVTMAFALRMAALFYFRRWWQAGGKWTNLLLGSVLLGAGVYDKTNFLWFVFALLAVGVAAWWMDEARPRIGLAQMGGALILMTAASLPLWIYNAYYEWVTFRMLFRPAQPMGFSAILSLIPSRSAVLHNLLSGTGLDVVMFGRSLPAHWGIRGTLLTALSVGALLVLLPAALFGRRIRLLLFPALIAALAVQIYFTPLPIGIHHWIMIYPFPHLMIGLALLEVSPAACGNARRVVNALGLVILIAAIGLNWVTMSGYRTLMRETGGAGFWTEAIYQLSKTVKDRYSDRPIQLMDWGMGNTLFMLSEGRLQLHEPYWPYKDSVSQPREELIRLAADPRNVFILNAPARTLFPNGREALAAAARRAKVQLSMEQPIYDRHGAVAYTIVQFSPSPDGGK